MQILLRQYEGKFYVWKEAEFNRDEYTIDGNSILQTNIIAIKGGNGGKFVRCKFCGEKMENKPEVIEKHFADNEAERDCLKCPHKRFGGKDNFARVAIKGENGDYKIQETYTSRLFCCFSYEDSETEKAVSNCMYNQHRKKGVEPIGGWLIDYPDLFAKQITVEALKAKGYEYLYRHDGFFVYDMKMRGTLRAFVNAYGIVDHFEASYRGYYNTFYYSATQGKLFYSNYGEYNDKIPSQWSDTKYETIKKKIADLYKEEVAK